MAVTFPQGVFHIADCRNILDELPDSSIDLVLTSPPYDDLRDYEGSEPWSFDVFKEIATKLSRVLRPGGSIVWITNDATISGSETGSSFRQALYFKDELGLRLHDTMIWNKLGFTGVGSVKVRYGPIFDYMFVLSKGKPKFNPIKDRKNKWAGHSHYGTLRQKDGSLIQRSNTGAIRAEYGIRFNIWEQLPHIQKWDAIHVAPFPLQLAIDHILSWTDVGDTVLDPFSGSGTTALACYKTSRTFIAIERVEAYHSSAVARFRKETGIV